MPAQTPTVASELAAKLAALGQQIRAHRKALRVSATAAAESAGMSRVTLHRIENGEASVTIGAYLNAMVVLGLDFGIIEPTSAATPTGNSAHGSKGWIPARVRLADYPQLKRLAWHVQGAEDLTPIEALGIYERNWRHLDPQAMDPHERDLVDALRLGLAQGKVDV